MSYPWQAQTYMSCFCARKTNQMMRQGPDGGQNRFKNEMQKRRNLLLNHDTRPNSKRPCFSRINNQGRGTRQGKTIGKTYPSAIKMKSANPCTITVRTFFSITLGSTVKAGGKLWSPFGNTLTLEHSVHRVSIGAWIASLTSRRLK